MSYYSMLYVCTTDIYFTCLKVIVVKEYANLKLFVLGLTIFGMRKARFHLVCKFIIASTRLWMTKCCKREHGHDHLTLILEPISCLWNR